MAFRLLLVTANVGSLFEQTDQMLPTWTETFLERVHTLRPHFIGLHCQEIGGKRYRRSMASVHQFVTRIEDSLQDFPNSLVLVDEDFEDEQTFTALASLYFVRQDVEDFRVFHFGNQTFESVTGRRTHAGNIETVAHKQKKKFPIHLFPDQRLSRKGFMHVRVQVCGHVLDLCNVHLFHDANNLSAANAFPSEYALSRRHALTEVLKHVLDDHIPLFVFGDFNFRLDATALIRRLCQTAPKAISGQLIFSSADDHIVLTLGRKTFQLSDPNLFRLPQEPQFLLEFDKELDHFADRLYEYPLSFPPSYPFEEEPNAHMTAPNAYMSTRCPAWCDRVLLNSRALALTRNENHTYEMIGQKEFMGDHKPVCLSVEITRPDVRYMSCGNQVLKETSL